MTRDTDTETIPAREPTPEERKASRLIALEESRRHQREMLAERGGKLFPPAADLLRELRGECEDE